MPAPGNEDLTTDSEFQSTKVSNMLSSITSHLSAPLLLYLLVALLMGTQFSYSLGSYSDQTSLPVPCLSDQASMLLQLSRSFLPTNESATAFRSWRAGTDCCDWEGVGCGDADGYVTSLHLVDWGLESAALDPVIFGLTSLRYLNLALNDFNGSQLPAFGFERLIELTHLNLSSSNFQGRIPVGIGRLTKLVSLDLSASFYVEDQDDHDILLQLFSNRAWQFVEPNIGSLITNLSNLKQLYLDRVDLSGNGLKWCGAFLNTSTPELQVLSLRWSNLFGPICGYLSGIRSLTEINLWFNYIKGPTPESLADLPFLRVLVLSNKGYLDRMRLLDLSYNNLSGSIPSCLLEDFNYLNVLNLKANQFHEKLPQNIKHGCALEDLDFSDNLIEGQLPRSLAACRDLQVVDIGNNQIHDTFPCWMGRLHKLQVLVIKSNKFVGKLGHEDGDICEFANLQIFDLASNNFSGILPNECFKSMKAMMAKSGEDTSWMERPDEPTYQFTATMTYKGNEEVTLSTVLKTLAVIDVSDNSFHGPIPQSLGDLVLLRGINLSHNALTGPIPSQLCALNQLEALDLSSNNLSGEIPQELASLDFLSTLNLSYNELEGRIPESPHFLTFANLSFLGNTGLCGLQVSKECNNITANVQLQHYKKKPIDIVLFLFVGLGFGAGFSVAIVLTWGIRIRRRSECSKGSFLFVGKMFCSLSRWLDAEMSVH
ncbi:unnamed protein product [Urochloa decumbens]|uniref:Leucine-rich repeat-containing N-terminal plant-type domain-containing protein n=1 Tax=Urochloa decumbens TaxID=240449 RepID=A0ABC8ZBF5_9POAL